MPQIVTVNITQMLPHPTNPERMVATIVPVERRLFELFVESFYGKNDVAHYPTEIFFERRVYRHHTERDVYIDAGEA